MSTEPTRKDPQPEDAALPRDEDHKLTFYAWPGGYPRFAVTDDGGCLCFACLRAERRLILLTLEHTRNNKTRAAEILGISLKTLHNKLNRMKETETRG